MKKKRDPGSKRARDKVRAQRAASLIRPVTYSRRWLKRYRALGPAPQGNAERGHQWLADLALLALEEAARDPGVPPEQRREQIGRLAGQAAKVLDPAKLAERIAQLERALEQLMERTDASYLPSRETGTA